MSAEPSCPGCRERDEIIRRLQATAVTLEGRIAKLLARVAKLEQRVRELEAQLQ